MSNPSTDTSNKILVTDDLPAPPGYTKIDPNPTFDSPNFNAQFTATSESSNTKYNASSSSSSKGIVSNPDSWNKKNLAGKDLPCVAIKYGYEPSASKPRVDPDPKYENYYSEERKAELRAKGINPALRAEMKDKTQRKWWRPILS